MNTTENLINHLNLNDRELGLIDSIIVASMLDDRTVDEGAIDPVDQIFGGLGIVNIRKPIPDKSVAHDFVAELEADGFSRKQVLDYVAVISLFHQRWDALAEGLHQAAANEVPAKDNVVQFPDHSELTH